MGVKPPNSVASTSTAKKKTASVPTPTAPEILQAISRFEVLNDMLRILGRSKLDFLDCITELHDAIRLSFEQVKVDISGFLPLPALPPSLIVRDYVGLDDSNHTLDEMMSHLIGLMENLCSQGRWHELFTRHNCDCLNVAYNDIRQLFEGLQIDTSDFGTFPLLPSSLIVPEFDAANDDGLDYHTQTLDVMISRTVNTLQNKLHRSNCLSQHLEVCIPVVKSNLDRGMELFLVRASESGSYSSNPRKAHKRLKVNASDCGPIPSPSLPSTVSNSNTQEDSGSDDSPHN